MIFWEINFKIQRLLNFLSNIYNATHICTKET